MVSARLRERRSESHGSAEPAAEQWLSEFRPIRSQALTAADRDAAAVPSSRAGQPAAQPRAARPGSGGQHRSGGLAGRGEPQDQLAGRSRRQLIPPMDAFASDGRDDARPDGRRTRDHERGQPSGRDSQRSRRQPAAAEYRPPQPARHDVPRPGQDDRSRESDRPKPGLPDLDSGRSGFDWSSAGRREQDRPGNQRLGYDRPELDRPGPEVAGGDRPNGYRLGPDQPPRPEAAGEQHPLARRQGVVGAAGLGGRDDLDGPVRRLAGGADRPQEAAARPPTGSAADLIQHRWAGPGEPRPRPVNEDIERTSPLPVILPGAASLPRPGPVERPRGPFEAARPTQPRPISVTGSVEPPPTPAGPRSSLPAPPSVSPGTPGTGGEPAAHAIPQAAAAKLDQIKDLYLTAEAIGEDALDKHFDQVSQRQQQLIKEFFERSGPGTAQ
jgi:hypothetical protein